jgi:hypothetical protein
MDSPEPHYLVFLTLFQPAFSSALGTVNPVRM